MTTPQCGDCNLFAGRCVHVNGRRAATSTTPTEGCSYFRTRGAPPVQPAAPHTAVGVAWSACPRCSTLKPQDQDGFTRCYPCQECWS